MIEITLRGLFSMIVQTTGSFCINFWDLPLRVCSIHQQIVKQQQTKNKKKVHSFVNVSESTPKIIIIFLRGHARESPKGRQRSSSNILFDI